MAEDGVMRDEIFGAYRRATTVDDEAGVRAGTACPSYDVAKGEWAVWLPHDCDEWLIASGTRQTVIDKTREFIASLQAAVDALEAQEG